MGGGNTTGGSGGGTSSEAMVSSAAAAAADIVGPLLVAWLGRCTLNFELDKSLVGGLLLRIRLLLAT